VNKYERWWNALRAGMVEAQFIAAASDDPLMDQVSNVAEANLALMDRIEREE